MEVWDWSKCRFLRPNLGNWGDPHSMSADLVFAVDEFCFQEGVMPMVTSGTGGKHSKNSFHYKGQAIDVMFYNLKRYDLPRVMAAAMQYPAFTGVGLYSDWRFAKNFPPSGGMHFEQDATMALPVVRKKLWVRTEDGDFAPTKEVLTKYFT